MYPTRRSKCTGLLDILPKRGPGAFDCLKTALRKTGQRHVLTILENTTPLDKVTIQT